MSAEPAPASRQYVACVFREGDARQYTYHNDGAPVAVGDRVRVTGRSGAEQVVIVAAFPPPCFVPNFETKPILGLAPDKPADEAPAEATPISDKPLPF